MARAALYYLDLSQGALQSTSPSLAEVEALLAPISYQMPIAHSWFQT